MSLESLRNTIPQSLRALDGFRSVGKKDASTLSNAKQEVSDAVAALEHMALAAASLFGFYKLTGGLSFSAVNANRLYSVGCAAAALLASPTGFQVTAGSFLAREGGLRAVSLYKDVAMRSLRSAAIAGASLAAGLYMLANTQPMSEVAGKVKGGMGLVDTYVIQPFADWAASKLVTKA